MDAYKVYEQLKTVVKDFDELGCEHKCVSCPLHLQTDYEHDICDVLSGIFLAIKKKESA